MISDPWTVLGVDQNATPEQIKTAYRKLARDHHPDLGGDPDKFREIRQAYEKMQVPTPSPASFDNFESVFQRFHGRFRPRNHAIHTQVEVSLAETITGTTKTLKIQKDVDTVIVDVQIPPGVGSGDTLKYTTGIAQNGHAVTLPCDLYVLIQVVPPSGYVLDQGSLITQCTLNLWSALLGTTVTVQDPLSGAIQVTVPPGVNTGDRLRVPGRGGWNRHTRQRGDILIEIQICMPELTSAQQEIIRGWI
jgi:curved DNA-binding protein